VTAGHRGGPRSSVRLQDVAVDDDLALAQRGEIAGRPQRAADEPLDLLRSPALLSLGRLAIGPGMRRARQHPVLRGHPAATASLHVARDALLRAGGAQDARAPEDAEDAPLRVLGEPGND